MAKRWLLGIAALVVALSVGAIGFAAFTSNTITIGGQVSSGNLDIYWNPSYASANGVYAQCAWTLLDAHTAQLVVTDLSPGDGCTVNTYINDDGSLPATSLTSTFTTADTDFCTPTFTYNCIQVSDSVGLNLLGGSTTATVTGTPVIAAGGYTTYSISVNMPSATTQTLSGTFTVSINGAV